MFTQEEVEMMKEAVEKSGGTWEDYEEDEASAQVKLAGGLQEPLTATEAQALWWAVKTHQMLLCEEEDARYTEEFGGWMSDLMGKLQVVAGGI